jgi:hypothetical protein
MPSPTARSCRAPGAADAVSISDTIVDSECRLTPCFVQVYRLVVALERLRGAVQGMLHYHGCVVYAVVGPALRPLAAAARLYAHHALITSLLFKLAAALVDALLGVVEASRAEARRGCLLQAGVFVNGIRLLSCMDQLVSVKAHERQTVQSTCGVL